MYICVQNLLLRSMQYDLQNIQAFAALSLSSMALLAFRIISSFFFSKDACLCDLSVDHAGAFRWFSVELPDTGSDEVVVEPSANFEARLYLVIKSG